MTIKFYGAISSGTTTLLTGFSHSNNFEISGGNGVYTITLNEWIAEQPIVMAAPVSTTGKSHVLVSGMRQLGIGNPAYQFTVTTYYGPDVQAVDFSFMVIAGSHLVVSASPNDTFVLQPATTVFGPSDQYRKILTTELQITGKDTTIYKIDAATRITIVSEESIDVSLGTLSGYTVEALTFQPGDSEGQPWTEGKAKLSPPSAGPVTVDYHVVVSATSGSGDVIWSDPVIRMSKEAPDGIQTRGVGS